MSQLLLVFPLRASMTIVINDVKIYTVNIAVNDTFDNSKDGHIPSTANI
jgi:hypothetical protein